MIDAHAAHAELVTRWAMAIAMVVCGFAAFVWPRCFANVAGYFTRWAAKIPPDEQERLSRVVEAREDAEGISANYGRLLGVTAFLLAALEAVRAIPPIVPYALFCLANATVALLAYLQFRRAVERRVAPLVRRSPFTALPAMSIVAVICSFAAMIALATIYSPERAGALAVAASTLLLGTIAWRIAKAPALLLGVDPQLEYAVDERVRVGRARNAANLACAPAFVAIALVSPTLPAQYSVLGTVVFVVVAASFVISLAVSLLPLRRPIVAV
jgi:hypothetical protein